MGKEKVCEMLGYKCPQQPGYKKAAKEYHNFTILNQTIWWGTFGHFERLIALIGNQAFIDNFNNLDGWNKNAMYYAVSKKKMKIIEYILSIDEMKMKYASDYKLFGSLVYDLNEVIEQKEIVQRVIDLLD